MHKHTDTHTHVWVDGNFNNGRKNESQEVTYPHHSILNHMNLEMRERVSNWGYKFEDQQQIGDLSHEMG